MNESRNDGRAPGAGNAVRGPVVCICGPTASGKSALADAVALEIGSDVISVDAMQVYRGMDIGTAKTPESERIVPLRMVDVAEPSEDYSVALFQHDARALVDERLDGGITPVLCGGTGLYLDAVIDEMDFPSGETGGTARSAFESLAADKGVEALWELLRTRDPDSAGEIHPNNVRRVVRALELLDEGTSYAAEHKGLKTRKPHYRALMWAIKRDRARLYERIDQRVDLMVDTGLVEEVQGLRERGLLASHTASQAIGYKEIVEALDGQTTLEEAVELIKRRSRRYAKRQLSWLRRDGRVRWLDIEALGLDGARDMVVGELRTQAELTES